MTASALNIASMTPGAPTGVGAAANPAAGGALAGFEALMGALFPTTDPNAVAAQPNVQAPSTLTGAPVNPDLLAQAGEGEGKGDAQGQTEGEAAAPVAAEGQPAPGDAAAALAASLAAAQTTYVQTQVTTAKGAADKDVDAAPPAWGRDKAKGAPAMPAILAANPKAGLVEKAELAAETGDETPMAGEAPVGDLPEPAPQVAPAARNAAQPPANPAPTASPIPAVAPGVQPESPAAAPAPSEPAVDTKAVETVETPATAAAASTSARPEAAAAAAAPLRPAKAERVKSADAPSAETPDELKPTEAADKPVHAKAAQGAAKAAAASVEAAEAKPQDAETTAESPDATGQGETRAAAAASTPASAQAGQVVRGSPETVANLAAQIVKKLEGKSTRFDVELDPHGLGKVDVRIEIGAQGRITAGMTFENPQAAADVKARAAELQRVLEQAGFDLSGGISFDVAGDRGHPQQQNQAWQDQGDAGRAFQGRAFRAALETAGDAADAANQGALRLRRGVNSGLDLRI